MAYDFGDSSGDVTELLPAEAPVSTPAPSPSSTMDALGVDTGKVLGGLVDLKKQEIGEKDAFRREQSAMIDRNLKRVEAQYNATAIQPGEFKAWDADAESAKRSTDPITAFGSLGSVFGLLASAFTRAPMENALNASAAAMNAVRAGDEQAYDRAHTAWKENTDLAFKRHQLQHQSYQDAITLMGTNMTAGNAKAQMLATKYGDKQSLLLLEAGMSKEWMEAQEKRSDLAVKIMENSKKLEGDRFQRDMFEKDVEYINKNVTDPTQRSGAVLKAFNHAFFAKLNPAEHVAFGEFMHANRLANNGQGPNTKELLDFLQNMKPHYAGGGVNRETINALATKYETDPDSPTFGDPAASRLRATEEVTKATTKAGGGSGMAPENAATYRAILDAVKTEHPEWTEAQQRTEANERYGKSKRAPVTVNPVTAQRAKTFEENFADVKAERPELTEGQQRNEANRRVEAAKATPTGNKIADIHKENTKLDIAIDSADRIVDVLTKHPKAAGIAGQVFRLEERIGNMLGTSTTEYVQMMREVQLLRLVAKDMLTDKNDRLKAEGQRIDDIVGGTSRGDTGPNSVASLARIQEVLSDLKAGNMKILEGTNAAPASAAPKKLEDLKTGARIRQNGVLFEKQEDGSMKPVTDKRSSMEPRQAPDGNYYVPDPARPGKYLMLVSDAA